MARKKIISDDIREQIIARVEAFNQANTHPAEPSGMTRLLQQLGMQSPTANTLPPGSYVPRFRGAFLYLDRVNYRGKPTKICRLKWTGDIDKWELLPDLDLPTTIDTSTDDMAARLYEPALAAAVRYDRGVGFFSSGWLRMVARGMAQFAANGGRARIITSPILDQADWEALQAVPKLTWTRPCAVP
jgi:hypothetical protein